MTINPIDVRPLAESETDSGAGCGSSASPLARFLAYLVPKSFGGDADFIATRWHAAPSAALGAFRGEELVGSNFVVNWGSVGFFGPLTVRPDLWDQGIGKTLIEPTLAIWTSRARR